MNGLGYSLHPVYTIYPKLLGLFIPDSISIPQEAQILTLTMYWPCTICLRSTVFLTSHLDKTKFKMVPLCVFDEIKLALMCCCAVASWPLFLLNKFIRWAERAWLEYKVLYLHTNCSILQSFIAVWGLQLKCLLHVLQIIQTACIMYFYQV